jgi:hypothetical protein
MKCQLILAVGLAALAACNKGPEVHERNASLGQVVNAAQEAGASSGMTMRPGQWELKTTIDEMTSPGVPAAAQARMKAMMGQGRTTTMCMTPEDVKRPGGKVLTGQETPNCTFDHYDLAGGKLDAAMRCNFKGISTNTSINGTFSPDSFINHVTSQTTGLGGDRTMKMTMEGRRVGECSKAGK